MKKLKQTTRLIFILLIGTLMYSCTQQSIPTVACMLMIALGLVGMLYGIIVLMEGAIEERDAYYEPYTTVNEDS